MGSKQALETISHHYQERISPLDDVAVHDERAQARSLSGPSAKNRPPERKVVRSSHAAGLNEPKLSVCVLEEKVYARQAAGGV